MTSGNVFFYIFAATACLSAVAVVLTQNIVRMAFWLLISLGATAGLFFLLGADFVGATQLLIYVGGTLVLLIFGVMLTARGPFISIKTSAGEWVIAAVVGSSLLAVLLLSIYDPALWTPAGADAPHVSATDLGLSLVSVRPDAVGGEETGVGYLLPFELASVHLLVVLIGAAYLARAKRRRVPPRSES
jgi:NADH:ubiquinone oxidoreductase subunit 6 (subunit J)